MTKQRTDLYQTVTNQIIAALESSTPPWVCPWTQSDTNFNPANLATGRAYRGINVLLLNMQTMARGYTRNRWLTYHQSQEMGCHVRKGEHGTGIVFFKMFEVDDAKGAATQSSDTDQQHVIPLLRSFTVFNIDQLDGVPAELQSTPAASPWDAIECAERLLTDSGAEIRYGGERAFYQPTADFIQMPAKPSFEHAADYYATALHELTHWTGHTARCNRVLGKRHGIEAYAFEELVAEMGAAFLTNHCRIPGRLQHASYIASWLQALKNDKRLIFTAASQAQRAADYLLQQESLDPSGVVAIAA